MAVTNAYLQFVLEQLSGLGRVTSRRMFGGVGLYCDEFFFGIVANDTLYFKVDDTNRNDYELRGMGPFRPFADKPDWSMSYYEIPADALEDGEELVVWARRSMAIAIKSTKPSVGRTRSGSRGALKRRKR